MIFDLETSKPLPKGWTPLEATAVIKCLDEYGMVSLYLANTKNISTWESVGMMTGALDTLRRELQEGFVEDEDDPND